MQLTEEEMWIFALVPASYRHLLSQRVASLELRNVSLWFLSEDVWER